MALGDVQWLQTWVWRRHGLRTLRLTLAQIVERGRLDSEGGGDLSVDGTTIAVTYFRAGYAPTDYPTEAEWRARRVCTHPLSLTGVLHCVVPRSRCFGTRGTPWRQ